MDNTNIMKLDDKDHKIINILKNNSRLSIRDIAKSTKIRPSTVHLRINKLVENNIIEKFTLKLNNKALGEDFIIFMLIETTEEIPKSFFSDKHVKEAFGITGEYDLLLKLKFGSIEEFNSFIINFRNKYKVKKTVTQVATINIKEEI